MIHNENIGTFQSLGLVHQHVTSIVIHVVGDYEAFCKNQLQVNESLFGVARIGYTWNGIFLIGVNHFDQLGGFRTWRRAHIEHLNKW